MITYEVFDSLLSLVIAAVTAASLALGEAPAQETPVEVEQQETQVEQAPAYQTSISTEEREGN